MKDFTTQTGIRLAVVPDRKGLHLVVDRPECFTTVPVTHQEARRLAFMLMGASDPYPKESEP